MPNKLRTTLQILAAFLFIGPLTLGTAWGNELWVTPAVKPADTDVGDWATTSSAKTHFSFAVPDEYSEFVRAKVVMIGKKTKESQ